MTTFEPGASDVFTHGLLVSPRATALRASSPAASMTDGFEVFVQLVIAAITTWPLSTRVSIPLTTIGTLLSMWPASRAAAISAAWSASVACSGGRMPARPGVRRRVGGRERQRVELDRVAERGLAVVAVVMRREILQRDPEGGLRLAQRDAVLRPARPGERRHDRRRGRARSCRSRRAPGELSSCHRPCSRAYASTSSISSGGRPENSQVADRLGVDREDRAGRAELRAHVADRRAVGERQRGEALAVELDELADDAALAQHLRDRQHEVGRGRALGQHAAQLEADDLRDQHRHRLAEHRRLGLDPADAPAEHAEAVDHRRVRVGPDERVGVREAARRRRTRRARGTRG